jgi:dTDP-4-amino-4,6-dideoxygalactose transaminase
VLDVAERVPVLRPQLARFEQIAPYLRRIDETRTYSNSGPLATEFEQRIGERLGVASVVSSGSGTAALVASILATAGRATPARPLAFLPAFSFVATALAAELCGYQPCFIDVDANTWALSPGRLRAHPALSRCGVVIVVAPFGRPFEQASWRGFRAKTGIDVVIDAAASFDGFDAGGAAAALGEIPVAVSFHPTKSIGVGEGGAVLTSDAEVARRALQAQNFGFYGSRDCKMPSFNGKLSEYHAAVGLAELDAWPQKRDGFARVARAYRAAASMHGIERAIMTTPDVSGCYVLLNAPCAAKAECIANALRANGIGSRFWYGDGIHRQEHFAKNERDALPVTDELAPRLLGIPVAPDLREDDIDAIVSIAAGVLTS